jgi:hypothetical protein
MLALEYYVGSGPNMSYPDLTEIIFLKCDSNKGIELNGKIGIELECPITLEIKLNGRTYN